ncbi:S41 family peptidase [bacterium]|nr:S41 family peptidase [bacterium]
MSKKNPALWVMGAVALLAIIIVVGLGQTEEDNLYANIKLFDRVAISVNSKYVEETNSKDLIYAGIRAMLKTLDPYTQFFEKSDYDELMVQTKGKFGGLGIEIGIRDDVLTVISPLVNTPAYEIGLQAGDRIIKIEGESTKGISTQGAVKKLRGLKGTQVTITVEREGESEPIDYTITRDIIEIKSVPYFAQIQPGLGYVHLARFSENAEHDLEDAIRQLVEMEIEGLILDLRHNPGGLLPQAVHVADLFLDKKQMIVYTKGRADRSTAKYESTSPPLYCDKPLIVLVNTGSASASEIVAGAIQDWDRGLILGTTTWGKGLVQTVIPTNQETALKITTAKYYTPSGRCIQRDDQKEEKFAAGLLGEEDLESPEELENREEFHTQGGRIVYGGGGITPDVIVKQDRLTTLEYELLRKSMIFRFAVKHAAKHKDLPRDFEMNDQLMAEFKSFLEEEDFQYRSAAEKQLDELSEVVEKSEYNSGITATLQQLEKQLQDEKQKDFQRSRDYLKRAIKLEIVSKIWGKEVRYEEAVKVDPQIVAAVEILTTPGRYEKELGT